jgi:broad specificity phosphatase PhoE
VPTPNDATSGADAPAPIGELVLVRHGATAWSTAGKHTGRTDIPLTDAGEEQALLIKPWLAQHRFTSVVSSPLVRARRTAELAGFTAIEIDPDLQEWDYGGFEGLTTPQIRERQPGWSLWRDGVPPGDAPHRGESAADVGARADRVVARALPQLPSGDVALVSHGHFLRVLAARWLGLPPTEGALFALDTASVSMLGFERSDRVVRQWNMPPARP